VGRVVVVLQTARGEGGEAGGAAAVHCEGWGEVASGCAVGVEKRGIECDWGRSRDCVKLDYCDFLPSCLSLRN
jgi:hypothetical protein